MECGTRGAQVASMNQAEFGLTTATIRAILSADTDATGRADQIAQRLGQAIRLGLILDGEQLPSESELSRRLGVAPVTLREALATLRERGLVVTRRGRAGGTLAHMPVDDDVDGPPPRLREFSTQDIRELGDHRRAISGMAARLAAERALPEEIEDLRTQVQRLGAAATPGDRRRADAQLSLLIAAAAQSTRLTHEEQQFRVEIGDLLWQPLDAGELATSIASRSGLVDAIAAREAERARELAEENILVDTQRLLQLRIEQYSTGIGIAR
jgi:GntR family transcriptional regulator, transcriptional repressor for pyruvate dehydrogenase complex